MRRYNARLLEFCRERNAECVELAARVPRTQEFFWDDLHLTEAGSRRVAEVVAAYLLEERQRMWPRRAR
jgi:hypothetical protein